MSARPHQTGVDPVETWLALAATTGRILAAVDDAQQTGDSTAADDAIRAALPELRRLLDEIETAMGGDQASGETFLDGPGEPDMDALTGGVCMACGASGIEHPDCWQCGHMIGDPVPAAGCGS